jgi:hypothetical protein
MRGAIPLLPNTSSGRGAYLSTGTSTLPLLTETFEENLRVPSERGQCRTQFDDVLLQDAKKTFQATRRN